jgi:hypothetical protein
VKKFFVSPVLRVVAFLAGFENLSERGGAVKILN